jgi:GAF domain-containing protein
MDQFRSLYLLRPESTTPRAMTRVIRAALPSLADFCLVFLAGGHDIACIGSAHTTPAGGRLVRALRRVYRVRRSDADSTVARVIRTGAPLLRREIRPDLPVPASHAPIADLHRRLATRSALVVPIRAGGKAIGAVSICYSHSGRSYQPGDLAAAEALAARVADILALREPHASTRLRAATRDPRQGTTVRRRVAARN